MAAVAEAEAAGAGGGAAVDGGDGGDDDVLVLISFFKYTIKLYYLLGFFSMYAFVPLYIDVF